MAKLRSGNSRNNNSGSRFSFSNSSIKLLKKVMMTSTKPLSSWEIEQELVASPGSSYTHTYYMLERLVPMQYRLEPLFVWEQILSNGNSAYNDNKTNKQFVRKINDVFKLQLHLDKQDIPALTSNEKCIDNIVVQKSASGDRIQVLLGRNKQLFEIKLIIPEKESAETDRQEKEDQQYDNKSSSDHKEAKIEEDKNASRISSSPSLSNGNVHTATLPTPILTLFTGREKKDDSNKKNNDKRSDNVTALSKKYKLVAEKNAKGQLVIYAKFFNAFDHIRYLDVELRREEKSKDPIEAMLISNDRRNWFYVPNLRGLLLVILDEVKQQQEQKRKELKKRRKHNVQLSHMLSNLSKYFSDKFPFLLYYDEFSKALRKKAKEDEKDIEPYLEVEALKKIAMELQYQIESADMHFLQYWVIKRYIEIVIDYFGYSLKAGLIKRIKDDISYAKLKEYYSNNTTIMIDYLESELEIRKAEYDGWCLPK